MLIDSKCSGCSACIQACPKNCISFEIDDKGFRYISVNSSQCVNCGICENVCHSINPFQERDIIECYAVRNSNPQIVKQSSSGGAFTAIAEYIILSGGVVCGAAFDENYRVKHILIDQVDLLHKLRGSKYVQSDTSTIFKQIRSVLESGRLVLFVGTSCQVAGLKRYLRKDYDLLYTVDVVCHGVVSPKVWSDYLHNLVGLNAIDEISGISFRDKKFGWKNYSLAIYFKNGSKLIHPVKEDSYLQCFVKNVTLRPSCFDCSAKSGKSGSDLSIADLWGIANILPILNDDKGVTCVLSYTQKGLDLLKYLDNIEKYEVDKNLVIFNNAAIMNSPMKPKEYESFWQDYTLKGVKVLCEYATAFKNQDRISLRTSIKLSIKKIVKFLFRR